MASKRDYQNVIAWQKATDLVEAVYSATASWPAREGFGLTSQAQRAAVAIPANIAEGKGRTGTREFLHGLSIAHGSLCELETHLLIAGRLASIGETAPDALLDQSAEVGRLLQGLIRSLR